MKTFLTTNILLASFLIASNIQPDRYDRQGGQVAFLFEDTDRLQKLVQSFYELSATVEPVAMGNALRTLKSVVHQYKNEERENSPYVKQSRRTN